MSIAQQIERLKKATAWVESPNYSYDSNRGQQTENERLSKILRAYEQVIKIQAEALRRVRICADIGVGCKCDSEVGFVCGPCGVDEFVTENIASVEKLLEEVK